MNKVKFSIIMTDAEEFIRNPTNPSSFWLSTENYRPAVEDWQFLQNVTVDLDLVDATGMVEKATAKIDEDITKAEGVIIELKRRKAELLALPEPDEENIVDIGRAV